MKCFLIPYFILLLETGKTPKPCVSGIGGRGEAGTDTWLLVTESKRKLLARADDANEAL